MIRLGNSARHNSAPSIDHRRRNCLDHPVR
ncbi:hypothetical protein SEA_FINKLE_42 [Gordonia phage Finkle]|uniref:Uncharacterized protein n=1 Tax=Gordonia phage Finkle TaxID=2926099 RepID=A0A9E7NJ36_9CAUD|nr:hypothetical protein QEH33_gp42 [Gordonia phage Finkle]UTN93002.1 hypothetical protein SEA_FINKLE_42 [Gordonia phage Finkle]